MVAPARRFPDFEGKAMKPCLYAACGVIAATFATTATAMPTGAAAEKGPGAYPMDCAKAKDKARCASLNQYIRACKDKTDDEWRECMHQPAPTAKFTPPKPRDCSNARNKEHCEAHASALEACRTDRGSSTANAWPDDCRGTKARRAGSFDSRRGVQPGGYCGFERMIRPRLPGRRFSHSASVRHCRG